jgi:hypothetical protein
MATISFDFSSTFAWPSTMRCRVDRDDLGWRVRQRRDRATKGRR